MTCGALHITPALQTAAERLRINAARRLGDDLNLTLAAAA
jgi:hypothetical protein